MHPEQPLEQKVVGKSLALVMSPSEFARVQDERKKIVDCALAIVKEIVEDNELLAHFGYSPELVQEIRRSWKAGESIPVCKIDDRYGPGQPLQFYEFNILQIGDVRNVLIHNESLASEMHGVKADLSLHAAITRSLKRSVEAADADGKKIIYIADDKDLDAERIIGLGPKGKITSTKIKLHPSIDQFGRRFYTNTQGQKARVLPPAWSQILDHKAFTAIMSHKCHTDPKYAKYKKHIIPTSFDLHDFSSPSGMYYVPRANADTPWCRAKPVDSCGGEGQFLVTSERDFLRQRHKATRYVFQGVSPEWEFDAIPGGIKPSPLIMRGYVADMTPDGYSYSTLTICTKEVRSFVLPIHENDTTPRPHRPSAKSRLLGMIGIGKT